MAIRITQLLGWDRYGGAIRNLPRGCLAGEDGLSMFDFEKRDTARVGTAVLAVRAGWNGQ